MTVVKEVLDNLESIDYDAKSKESCFFEFADQFKIYWITICITTGYSFPLFSSLPRNEGRRKGEGIGKSSSKQVFSDPFNFNCR